MAPNPPKKQSYWRIVLRQFMRRRLSVLGAGMLLLLFGVALGAPFIASETPLYLVKDGQSYWLPNVIGYDALFDIEFDRWEPGPDDVVINAPIPYAPERTNLRERLLAPSGEHWLGTDSSGRDVMSRLVWGTRISMSVGFVAVGISIVIGIVIGAAAGYYRGKVDMVVLRAIETMMCFPDLILILALIAYLGRHISIIMLVIGITRAPDVARLVRGEFLKLRDSDFAVAARATGLSDARIMFRHILPNALAPVLVNATFGVAGAILVEAALSFLGLGVPPPTASWGETLSQSREYIQSAWWLVTFPGVAIFVTVTMFNLVGEGLRDAMDPRLRQ